MASFESGYSAINREWSAGDTITIEMPMAVQRLKADNRIEADRGTGRVALRSTALQWKPSINPTSNVG